VLQKKKKRQENRRSRLRAEPQEKNLQSPESLCLSSTVAKETNKSESYLTTLSLPCLCKKKRKENEKNRDASLMPYLS
jgi:hypothetical protein